MLVLSRRSEEEIVIDGQIRIKVLSNSRGKVRLGITAPEEVQIQRSEQTGPRTIECLTPPRWEGRLTEDRGPVADQSTPLSPGV